MYNGRLVQKLQVGSVLTYVYVRCGTSAFISYYSAHSLSFALCLYLAAYIGFLFSFSGNCSVYALSEFYVKVIWDISCKLTILPYNYFRKPEMVCGVWKLLVEKERLLLRGAGEISLYGRIIRTVLLQLLTPRLVSDDRAVLF